MQLKDISSSMGDGEQVMREININDSLCHRTDTTSI